MRSKDSTENLQTTTSQQSGEEGLLALVDSLLEAQLGAIVLLKCVWDHKDQITDFTIAALNRPFEALSRLSRNTMIGQLLSEVPSLLANKLNEQLIKVVETKQALEEEFFSSDHSVWLQYKISPFEDGVLLSFQDTTIKHTTLKSLTDKHADYRDLANNMKVGFVALDKDLRYVFINSVAELQLGTSAKEAVGQSIYELLPELRGSSTEKLYQETIRTQRPQRIVSPHWIAGKQFCFEVEVYPSTTGGIVVFNRDITQRKRSEEALKASKAHLSEILNSVNEVVFSYHILPDGDYNYEYFSAASKLIWGYTPAELIENKYLLVSRVLPQYQELFTTSFVAKILHIEIVTIEYQVLHQDGSIRWIFTKLIPHRDQSGSIIVTGIAVDITNRKRPSEEIYGLDAILEKQAAAHTEELESLINAIPDHIFVVERATMRLTFCNNTFAQRMGFSNPEQVQGKTISECLPSVDAEKFMQQSLEVFNLKNTVHEHETIHLSNGIHHFDSFKIPLKRENGEVYALLGIAHDITELINTRQELSKQTKQLEATNHELEAFSYSVSHDLRAPLRAIDGYTRILLEEYGNRLDDEGQRLIDVITNNAKKMGQLIDDLLDFSRFGRKELIKMDFDINGLVQSILVDLKKMRPERNISSLVQPLEPAQGDVNMLKQAWINILSNAVKYTRNQATTAIEIGSFSNDTEVTYYVKDNGVGFDMQYADKLFGVFQRLHAEEEFEGTGVGLAIAHRIIARHGGRIWAKSRPAEGATFYFTLPK